MANERAISLGRRRFLGLIAGFPISTGLAGCLGADSPEPITIPPDRECDNCGMIIHDHPGPIGQVFFADESDPATDPAQFCSSTCTYRYRFAAETEGREPVVTYLTDYSSVEYTIYEEGGDLFVTQHPESIAFAPTSELWVAVRTDVLGAMGADFHPFSDHDDAERFAEEYTGNILEATAVTPDLLDAI